MFGALLAIPLTRLGGVNFALGTLAWAFFLALVPFGVDSIRNHDTGWAIRAPTLDLPGLNWINDLLVRRLSSNAAIAKADKFDFSRFQEQILLFLVIFGLLTLVIHALHALAIGSR